MRSGFVSCFQIWRSWICRLSNAFLIAHERAEDFGDQDGAVFLLVVFQDGDEGAADGGRGSVESVGELFAIHVLEADFGAARLEVGAVGGAGEFAEFVL